MSKRTDPPPDSEPDNLVLALTRAEADALLQLIDIALKAAGLPVAQAATHLASRIVGARDMGVSVSGASQTESR